MHLPEGFQICFTQTVALKAAFADERRVADDEVG